MSQRGTQWVVGEAVKRAGIRKEVHTHTLRHSYATHLLEQGVNILVIKELLGHAHIRNHDGVSAYCKTLYPKCIQPFGYAIQRSLMQPQHEVATVLNTHWQRVQQSAKLNTWQLRYIPCR